MRKDRTERVAIRLSKNEKKEYISYAEKQGMSLSALFRRAVKEKIWHDTAVKS